MSYPGKAGFSGVLWRKASITWRLGRGNGNPLQYSCLENPRDRGSWRVTVHGITKDWTWLSDIITTKLQILSGNQQVIFYWIVNICSAVGDIERWTKSAYNLGRCYHHPESHRACSKSSTHYVQLISKWCFNPQCLSSEQGGISEATWGRSRQHLAGSVAMVKFG